MGLFAKERTIEAIYTSGRMEQTRVAQNGATYVKRDITTFYCIFALEDGDAVELRTDYNDYCSLVPGDRGLLTYKGARLTSFTPLDGEKQTGIAAAEE